MNVYQLLLVSIGTGRIIIYPHLNILRQIKHAQEASKVSCNERIQSQFQCWQLYLANDCWLTYLNTNRLNLDITISYVSEVNILLARGLAYQISVFDLSYNLKYPKENFYPGTHFFGHLGYFVVYKSDQSKYNRVIGLIL